MTMTRAAGPGATEVAALIEWVGQHLSPPHWHGKAACRNVGSDMFFVGQGRSGKKAKAICATCPAVSSCREWALSQRHLSGIWGGMNGPELAAERKRRAAAQSA